MKGIFFTSIGKKSRILIKVAFLVVMSFLFWQQTEAQSGAPWNGKQCTVVLTYDDALNVHLDNAVPILDSLGFRATFYLSAYFPGCANRLRDWTAVAESGHELGNHTLFHPCDGRGPGREWVSDERDLSSYSVQRLLDEVRMTNVFLKALDGRDKRTFAYPCGDTRVGDSSFVHLITNDFTGARIVKNELAAAATVDLFTVPSYAVSGQSGEEMIGWVRNAMREKKLLVILFHGVGGEHALNVGLREHRQLLTFLKENESAIWVAPMVEVVDYIKNRK